MIKSLNDTLYIIKSINEGNESGVFSSLGLNSKINFNDMPKSSLFIAKVMGSGAIKNNTHKNSILTESFDKTFESQKNTVENALNLHYTITESISMAVANSISALSLLSENIGDDDPAFNESGMNNIIETLTEGVIVMRDALENVFSGIDALNKKAREVFTELLGEGNVYSDLIANAIIGANTLYSLDKIIKFKNENINAINESTNSLNAITRADDILNSILTLEENIIKSFNGISRFDRDIVNVLSENNTNLAMDISDYIASSINKIAIPIMEGNIDISDSSELQNAYITAVTSIGALYDEYILDCAA